MGDLYEANNVEICLQWKWNIIRGVVLKQHFFTEKLYCKTCGMRCNYFYMKIVILFLCEIQYKDNVATLFALIYACNNTLVLSLEFIRRNEFLILPLPLIQNTFKAFWNSMNACNVSSFSINWKRDLATRILRTQATLCAYKNKLRTKSCTENTAINFT